MTTTTTECGWRKRRRNKINLNIIWVYIRITFFVCSFFSLFWLLIKIILICNAMRASFTLFKVFFLFFISNTLEKEYIKVKERNKRQTHESATHKLLLIQTHTISLTFLTSGAYSSRKFAASSSLLCPRHSFDLTQKFQKKTMK